MGGFARSIVEQLWPRSQGARVRVGACFVAGALAGWLLAPGASAGVSTAPPHVELDGHAISVSDKGAAVEEARRVAREYLQRPVVIKVPGAQPVERTRAALGARVDPERLAALLTQAADAKSAMRRAHARRGSAPLSLPMPVALDPARSVDAVMQLKDDVDRAPVDARLDLASRKVIADEPGVRLDVYATLSRLDAALRAGAPEVDAVAESVAAKRTKDVLADVSFEDVLGYFETRYARDLKHEARTFNLRLAASKLDGHVLLPGEVFDFNDVVGPRDEAHGYKVAPVIAQGELVDGIGGGTCQIAGTLHGAAFFGGVDIVERKPHTRPSFYIKMGMDATVVYPTITLKLRNPFKFPIVLHETVTGGVVRAEILGPKRTRDVTFVRKVSDVTPFREKEVPDPKTPRGERTLAQRGIPGFKVTRYRLLRDGPFAVRERMVDSYPSTTQIWKVGTGDPDPKWKGRDDEHPEYVADEYLAISQGPHIVNPKTGELSSEPGGAMVESRVAGKYGTHGWTVREGFAKAMHGSRGGGGGKAEDGAGVD